MLAFSLSELLCTVDHVYSVLVLPCVHSSLIGCFLEYSFIFLCFDYAALGPYGGGITPAFRLGDKRDILQDGRVKEMPKHERLMHLLY